MTRFPIHVRFQYELNVNTAINVANRLKMNEAEDVKIVFLVSSITILDIENRLSEIVKKSAEPLKKNQLEFSYVK
nr:hypothetical protein [Sulfolobus islandicus]